MEQPEARLIGLSETRHRPSVRSFRSYRVRCIQNSHIVGLCSSLDKPEDSQLSSPHHISGTADRCVCRALPTGPASTETDFPEPEVPRTRGLSCCTLRITSLHHHLDQWIHSCSGECARHGRGCCCVRAGGGTSGCTISSRTRHYTVMVMVRAEKNWASPVSQPIHTQQHFQLQSGVSFTFHLGSSVNHRTNSTTEVMCPTSSTCLFFVGMRIIALLGNAFPASPGTRGLTLRNREDDSFLPRSGDTPGAL